MIKVINDLYRKAMQTEDMKTGGKHVLELSPYDYQELVKSDSGRYDVTVSGHRQYFRGLFRIRVIHGPLEDITTISPTNEVKQHWRHVATHVERSNGRIVYYDWDGNDRSVLWHTIKQR
jgi:hypothetical protein